jgi:hypothetical protein
VPDYDFQVILKDVSGKPEDVYVNTLHFQSTTAEGWDPDSLSNDLAAIYQDKQNFLSLTISGGEIRAYNPDDPMPRQPRIHPFAIEGGSSSAPTEVALCLSYYADNKLPRNRGRIYVGPWGTANHRPDSAQMNMLGAMAAAFSALGGANVQWQQVSKTGAGHRKKVTNWWVDDAWDTQRRRGVGALTRITGTVDG